MGFDTQSSIEVRNDRQPQWFTHYWLSWNEWLESKLGTIDNLNGLLTPVSTHLKPLWRLGTIDNLNGLLTTTIAIIAN